jgi:hypothetical protein
LVLGKFFQWIWRAHSGLVCANSVALAAPRAMASTIAGSASMVFCMVAKVKSGSERHAGRTARACSRPRSGSR